MKKAPAKMNKKSMAKMKKAPTKKIIDTNKLSGGKKRLVEGVTAAKMKKSAMKMKKESMAMMKKSVAMMKKASSMKMKKK